MAVSALVALASTTASAIAGTMVFSTFMATFAFNFALGLALRALTPKPSISGADRGYQVNTKGSALDHQIIYGQVRVGGAIIYDESTGEKNKYLHRIIAVAGHEVDSFQTIYIDDEEVTLDENGFVTSPSKYTSEVITRVQTGTDGDGRPIYTNVPTTESKVRIITHNGASDQAADSLLVEESDGLWTNAHRLRGIAYMYVRMEYDATVFPDGIPTITAEVRGKKVFNPVSGTTSWSDNPALCLRDYLSSTSYGLGEADDNIDDTLVSAAAAVCNETNTQDGTTRYTCNGAFTTAVTPYEMLDNMLTSMGGTLWYAQGKWRMKPAYWTAPVLDLNEDDLRSDINVSTRHSRRDNFNAVRGTFRGPESNWQTTDYPKVDSPGSLLADNNQESIADVDLPFTDNSIEARRIARIALESNRQQLTITASFGLRALSVQVGDNVRITNARFGWDNKAFQVLSWDFGLTDGLDLQVTMTLRETAESVFDEIDDGEAYERDNTTLPNPFDGLVVSNLVAYGGGKTQGDGTFINSVLLDWDDATSSFLSYYEVQWKPLNDSSYSSTTIEFSDIEISPLIDGIEYTFRVRAVSVSGVKGEWTEVQFTGGGDETAPSLPTSIKATGGFRYITIEWTNPPEADFNYVEVWENTSDTLTGASKVGQSSGDSFTRTNLGLSETRYYFLRSVDYTGNESDFTTDANWETGFNSAQTTFLDNDDFENSVRGLFIEQGLDIIEPVLSLPPAGDFVGQNVFLRTDGKLYQWTGSSWSPVVADIPDGSITATQIDDNAITTPKLSADAVTAAKIKAGTITTSELDADNIKTGLIQTAGIIANAAMFTDGVIENASIQNLAVERAKIGNNAANEVFSFNDSYLYEPNHVPFTDEFGYTLGDPDLGTDEGTSGFYSFDLDFEGNAATVADVIVWTDFNPVGAYSGDEVIYRYLDLGGNNMAQGSRFPSSYKEARTSGSIGLASRPIQMVQPLTSFYDNYTLRVRYAFKQKNVALNGSGQRGFTISGVIWVRYR